MSLLISKALRSSQQSAFIKFASVSLVRTPQRFFSVAKAMSSCHHTHHDHPSRVVLVTGGGSGIGRGICELLAQKGHEIVVTDLNLEAAKNVAEAITTNGGKATAHALDVANKEAVDSLIGSLEKSVDVLVNNAGLQHVCKIEDFPPEKFQLLTNIMLVGPALLTRACLPKMREKNFGRIINVGSIHSVIASPFKSAYVAAKHGLLGFSKVVALETGNCDITINTISPAYVKTPLVEAQIEAQARENKIPPSQVVKEIMLKPMPKGVFIELEEMSATCEFLMSPYARNITGQCICIDGGWTIQ